VQLVQLELEAKCQELSEARQEAFAGQEEINRIELEIQVIDGGVG
jgi:hypothetical protein